MDIIERVYRPDGDEENHKKMLYIRKANPQFQYTVADLYDSGSIYIGGKAIREYCEKIRNDGRKIDTKNKFYNSFKV